MELKQCSSCGRTFGSDGGETLCKRCFNDKYEDDFKKVRDYLYDNPGADIKEVSYNTGVEETLILKFLKQERLQVAESSISPLRCSVCGIEIRTGTMCDKCKKTTKLAKDLKKAAQGIKETIEDKRSPKNHYHSR